MGSKLPSLLEGLGKIHCPELDKSECPGWIMYPYILPSSPVNLFNKSLLGTQVAEPFAHFPRDANGLAEPYPALGWVTTLLLYAGGPSPWWQ